MAEADVVFGADESADGAGQRGEAILGVGAAGFDVEGDDGVPCDAEEDFREEEAEGDGAEEDDAEGSAACGAAAGVAGRRGGVGCHEGGVHAQSNAGSGRGEVRL